MSGLNFAIIGFGKMGSIRYDTLSRMPGCTVRRICEPDKGRLFPEGVTVSADIKEILKDSTIDAIVVSTPNHVLKDSVVLGLQHGKHVFCEKPPGRNLAELAEMSAAEEKGRGLKLMFGFNHRHHESMIYTKRLIDSGEYGNILWLRGRYGKSVDHGFFSNWRSKREFAGGGIFLDQGIHMLDLFLMFCGDFQEVKSYVSNLYWKLGIEDNVFAMFRNNKGQVASLHSTMTQWRHLFSLEIFLGKGYMTINGLKTSSNTYGDEILSVAKNRSLPPEASWTDEEKVTFHVDSSWRREMEIFKDCIVTGRPVPTGNTRDALKLMKLVEMVYGNND